MKFWKRNAALLMAAVMLSGSFGQPAVIAAEPEIRIEAEKTDTEAEETQTEAEETKAEEPETEAAEQTETIENETAQETENPEEAAQEKEDSEEEALQEAETVKEGGETVYSGRPTDSQPVITSDTKSLTLVKGQKFVLGDETWTSSDKKILSVSKTKAKAKKAGTVKLSNGSQTIDVTVVAPSFENKSVKMTAGEEREIPLNNTAGLAVYYESLNPNVAGSYGINNEIVAMSKGSAVINAYVNGVVFKYTVKVAEVDAAKKDFTKPVDLMPMQSVKVKLNGFKAAKAAWTSYTMVPADKVPEGYVFEDAVVRIDKKGRITAIGEGTTVLTATGGSAEPVEITVNVSAPYRRIVTTELNKSAKLKLYGVKGNVEWEARDEGIVRVEKNKVTGIAKGYTILYGRVENFVYEVAVFVEDPTITTEGISKKGNKYSLEMKEGSSVQILYGARFSSVPYRSSDCSVAYADEYGIIHARRKGSAKLSGKINGKTVTITVKVQEVGEKE